MTNLLSRVLQTGIGVCLAWGVFANVSNAAQGERVGVEPLHSARLSRAEPGRLHPGVQGTLNNSLLQTETISPTNFLAPEAPQTRGAITGRVTDTDSGEGIAFTQISINRYDDSSGFKFGMANADGYFTLTNILTGVYALTFDAPLPYFSERYNNTPLTAANPPTLIAVTAGFTATNINAALRKGFVISGIVTDQASGDPLSNVQVFAERGDGTSFGNVSAKTSGGGQYTLGPLEAGGYRLRFVPAPNDAHAAQWHANANTYAAATLLNVSGDLANINAALAYGSAITGTVTNAAGDPLAGVSVSIHPAGVPSSTGATATSGAAGQYVTSPGLAPGVYQALFATPDTSPYLDAWYANQTSPFGIRFITVTAGISNTDVNMQLGAANGGGITGLLLAANTGAILTGTVSLYRGTTLLDTFRTEQGVYTITNLLPGAYKLYFAASTPTPYAPVYLGGGADLASSTPVNVSAAMTASNVNQALPLAGDLTGVVTSGGTPLPGVAVVAMGKQAYSTYSGSDGAYRFLSMSAGVYRITFSPPAPFVAGVKVFTVTAGVSVTNANLDLIVGGRITGTVLTQDTHAPMSGAVVKIEQAATPNTVTYAYTDLNGQYTSPGLPSGNYTVSVQPGTYWGQYLGSAIPLSVNAANITPNIAFTPERGGTLSGFVCGSAGYPMPVAITVAAFNATTGQLINATAPNAFGYYQLAVPPGAYKVRFSSAGFFTRWYASGTSLASATPVTVAGTSDTPNIGLCLSPGAAVYMPFVS